MGLIGKLIDFFTGGAGGVIGQGVANVATAAALLPALIAVWKWYEGHATELAVSFSWSQVVFVGLIIGAIIKVAHWTRPPG